MFLHKTFPLSHSRLYFHVSAGILLIARASSFPFRLIAKYKFKSIN